MISRNKEHLIALGILAAVACGAVVGAGFSTFRMFFSWPGGATWSNVIAWVEGLLTAWFVGWYLRDRIGRGLVGWLHQHHAPHHQKMLDDHHDRLASILSNHLVELNSQVAEIRAALRSVHQRLDGD